MSAHLRSLTLTFLFTLISVICAGAQVTQINPLTQIRWPAVTGSGAPTAPTWLCGSGNYGQPYTDITANSQYVCSSAGWTPVGTGTGGASIQTNSVTNTLQTLLNFTNPSSFNGLSFTFSNPSGGVETFTVSGALSLSGLASEAANTVVGNFSNTSGSPTSQSMPNCASGALSWTAGTGFGCNALTPGTQVFVNGGTVLSSINFNALSPAPDANYIASAFKYSAGSAIVEVPYATSGALGVVEPDGTTIGVVNGVISVIGGGGSGITQLTGDTTAGPGSGSVASTVVGMHATDTRGDTLNVVSGGSAVAAVVTEATNSTSASFGTFGSGTSAGSKIEVTDSSSDYANIRTGTSGEGVGLDVNGVVNVFNDQAAYGLGFGVVGNETDFLGKSSLGNNIGFYDSTFGAIIGFGTFTGTNTLTTHDIGDIRADSSTPNGIVFESANNGYYLKIGRDNSTAATIVTGGTLPVLFPSGLTSTGTLTGQDTGSTPDSIVNGDVSGLGRSLIFTEQGTQTGIIADNFPLAGGSGQPGLYFYESSAFGFYFCSGGAVLSDAGCDPSRGYLNIQSSGGGVALTVTGSGGLSIDAPVTMSGGPVTISNTLTTGQILWNTHTATASASTVALPATISHITGTSAINNFTGASSSLGQAYYVIADGAWTTTTSGNIKTALTAVVGQEYGLTFDGSFWYIQNANSGGGGSSAFSALLSGINSTAAMVVSTGASLSYTGSGTIKATTVETAASTTNAAFSILASSATTGDQEPVTIVGFTINPLTGAFVTPGAVASTPASGVPGVVYLSSNSGTPSLVPNTVNLIGASNAAMTAYGVQYPSTAPTNGQVLVAGTAVGGITPMTWTTPASTAGVASINGSTGAFTFGGSGVSCTGTTCTFSGTGTGVSSFTGDGIVISNSASTGSVTATLRAASAYSILGNTAGTSVTPTYTSNPVVSTLTTVGSGGFGGSAGVIDIQQGPTNAGSAPCTVATSICIQAPTSVTSYTVTMPSAAASGARIWTNASGLVTESILPTAGSGAGVTTGPTTSVSNDLAQFIGSSGQISDSAVAVSNLVLLNNTQTISGTKSFSAANTTFNSISINAIATTGSAPTMAPGAGAGTSPTCTSITGNNVSGVITCTTGTSPLSASTLATITFNGTVATAPQGCRLMPRGSNAASAINTIFTAAPSTSGWTISVGTAALAASTIYTWSYQCM